MTGVVGSGDSSRRGIAIIGSGGQAKIVASTILALDRSSKIYVYDDSSDRWGQEFWYRTSCPSENLPSITVRNSADLKRDFIAYKMEGVVVGIGNARIRREKVAEFGSSIKWSCPIVHPSAVVEVGSFLGEGTLVCAGAVVQTCCTVGAHCIINTKASCDHECTVNDFAHIGPGAVLCGQVSVGHSVFVGAGAVVKQCLELAPRSTIGMGAVVIRDIALADETWVGVPARKQEVKAVTQSVGDRTACK